ncbi:MAG: hypothetical protein MJ187_02065 [Alphaproteobacteria bacterium]|nr:hypothetical protein [Alphaproteobacteria bacterium]
MKKYFIQAFGCDHNRKRAQEKINKLESRGFSETVDPSQAKYVVLYTCPLQVKIPYISSIPSDILHLVKFGTIVEIIPCKGCDYIKYPPVRSNTQCKNRSKNEIINIKYLTMLDEIFKKNFKTR